MMKPVTWVGKISTAANYLVIYIPKAKQDDIPDHKDKQFKITIQEVD